MTQRTDLTLRELQTNLPWSIRYSADFRANPQPHKDFAHALTHIVKAAGALAALVDDMDHRRETADSPEPRQANAKYVADLVVCALRLANTFPGRPLDLQLEVEHRIESKNDVKLPRPSRQLEFYEEAMRDFWATPHPRYWMDPAKERAAVASTAQAMGRGEYPWSVPPKPKITFAVLTRACAAFQKSCPIFGWPGTKHIRAAFEAAGFEVE